MISDVVLVALITGSSVLGAALVTQFIGMKAAARVAERAAKQEALKWQRDEAIRKSALNEARFREFWSLVLLGQGRIVEWISLNAHGGPFPPTFAESPAGIVAQAYAVALLGLNEVRALTKELHFAVVAFQVAVLSGDGLAMEPAVLECRRLVDEIEEVVIRAVDATE